MRDTFRHLLGMATTLAFAAILTTTLTACRSNDGAAAQESDETEYAMGEPIQDTTLAAVVTSEYGADTLTSEEFRGRIARITRQVPQLGADADQSRELRKNIVEDFVLRHALFGEADRLGLSADTAEVRQRLEQIKGQFPSEEEFEAALASDNISEQDLLSNIEDMLKQDEMLAHFAQDVAEPAEEEVAEFRSERAQQVRASHILFLVPEGADESHRDSVLAVAGAVLDSVQAGENFADLARRHSEDGTAQRGGDLGYFSRGQMVEPFEESAFALPDSGAVTDELVETRYGYHIIQLTGRRTGELMDSTQARQLIVRNREQEAVEERIDDLRGKVTVRVNPMIVNADLNEQG